MNEDQRYCITLFLDAVRHRGGKAKYGEIAKLSGLSHSEMQRTKWMVIGQHWIEQDRPYMPYKLTEKGRLWLEEEDKRLSKMIEREMQ